MRSLIPQDLRSMRAIIPTAHFVLFLSYAPVFFTPIKYVRCLFDTKVYQSRESSLWEPHFLETFISKRLFSWLVSYWPFWGISLLSLDNKTRLTEYLVKSELIDLNFPDEGSTKAEFYFHNSKVRHPTSF